MIAIDTNVLVRVLTDDDASPEQTALARQLVKEAKAVYVPQIVQIELVWVLERAYGLDKAHILLALQLLRDSPMYQLQHQARFALAIERYRSSNAGFADSLIVAESGEWGLREKPPRPAFVPCVKGFTLFRLSFRRLVSNYQAILPSNAHYSAA